jgi:hypothetical protein
MLYARRAVHVPEKSGKAQSAKTATSQGASHLMP